MQKNIEFSRPTWTEIDLGALEYNFKQLKRRLSKDTKILVAVKANAYGHGMVPVARRLAELGVDYLGVASVDEAIKLRESGISAPVLVFGAVLAQEVKNFLNYRIAATVCDIEMAKALNRQARLKSKEAVVHIKVDTGMGRIGIWHEQALGFVKRLTSLRNLKLEGIYTHLSSADSDRKFTNHQISCFNKFVSKLSSLGLDIPLVHAANSMATAVYKRAHLNLVRPGLMIYGLYPREELRNKIRLKPVLSLKSRIVFLKHVPGGRSISYNRTHITARPTKIATLPIGYADGYNRALSNRASILIKSKRVPVVGRICMDQTMIDVGKISGARIGQEVVLIGRQGNKRISAEELARLCGTISYEIVCWISNRVPRVYLD